jgi:hypothetical protein
VSARVKPCQTRFHQILLTDDQLRQGPRDREIRWLVPGDPVMLLAAEPADIAEQFGVTFQETFDGLDDLRVAVLELDTGLRFAFARHYGQPVAGTQLLVRGEDPNRGDVADSVIDALGLQADVLWRRDSGTQAAS